MEQKEDVAVKEEAGRRRSKASCQSLECLGCVCFEVDVVSLFQHSLVVYADVQSTEANLAAFAPSSLHR